MVDTQHLKCCDHYGRTGSSPVLGTQFNDTANDNKLIQKTQ